MPATPGAVDLQEQSSIYLKERNLAMRLKRVREEMLLAKERNLLIEKRLVERQPGYWPEHAHPAVHKCGHFGIGGPQIDSNYRFTHSTPRSPAAGPRQADNTSHLSATIPRR